jgi:Domain of unknown function (DUF4402)
MAALWRTALLGGALSLSAVPASATEPDCSNCALEPSRNEDVELRIEIRTQLNFSRATVGKSGGQINIDPDSGNRQLAGSAVDLGGMALAGTAIVTGTPGKIVRIDMPDSVRMTNNRGGVLNIRNLRTNLSALPRLDAFGKLEFAFGGDLVITGGAFGDYRGRIPITAQYE